MNKNVLLSLWQHDDLNHESIKINLNIKLFILFIHIIANKMWNEVQKIMFQIFLYLFFFSFSMYSATKLHIQKLMPCNIKKFSLWVAKKKLFCSKCLLFNLFAYFCACYANSYGNWYIFIFLYVDNIYCLSYKME